MTIREIRKSLNMSQAEFSRYFQIPVGNIQHWEQAVSLPPMYVPYLIERVIALEKQLEEMKQK